ncbi:Uncharacterised protein [Mycobacteroides abscessus subsp. abscessus]|uniref:phage terminase small subunit n=1 Tax=Mycobacteroides abscessus TaxID=36809 RepID=UPI0009261ED1|nr:hypothetical protein [Mycobacteroides abscessus]SHS98351.1 Uncharacterised protein [Mycobacteroides abscessus subsp. abscessus]SLK64852.1 Uncharacterised protein [Mycobacteroides abscessus subsp. abscessus]
MAGSRGPIAERSDATVRRNIGDPITKIDATGQVQVPDLDLANAHPLVKDIYQSMKDSAQARYYEPTDWQYARLTLYAVNEMLLDPKGIGAMKLTAVNQMLTSLLLTEGDRRRVRIEIERKPAGPEGVVIDAQDQFKQWMEQK